MKTQLTFVEDNFIYSFSREHIDGEGYLPVTVEFDSIYDFAKALSKK